MHDKNKKSLPISVIRSFACLQAYGKLKNKVMDQTLMYFNHILRLSIAS